ncbi:mucin-15 [Erinaceus europaeus]|uniref:Mucin-15 n=1 Tax=Erinaceus europaeus TaxID=9365 RepID=A0A1S3AJL4_ERIEU|nr:mucin-15 [Erinaceus europaeus]
MLTSAKILLISTLLSSLMIGSYGKGDLEVNTIQTTANDLKTTEKKFPLESKLKLKLDKEKGETFNPNVSNTSFVGSTDTMYGITDTLGNLSTEFSANLKSTSTLSTSSPSLGNFVSKFPLNSSVAEETSIPDSELSSATSIISSDNFTSSFENETMTIPENSSSVGTFSSVSTTMSVTPMLTESDIWLATTTESMVGFIPYQETETLQPTSKFTNNSKIFPNGSDPQEDNRNTGVVFGAILGAILGASLLSLVGYLLCGKRKTDSFSHRRLYDDRNEPVLRLDNALEPYDVSFGNSSYYNPNMNDSSTPAGQENTRDGIPMDDIPPLRTSV